MINHPAWCRACNFVHTVHGSHRHPPSCTAELEEKLSGVSGGSSLECPRVSCTSSVQRPRSSALPPSPTASAPRNYSGPLARANQVLEVSGRLAIDAEAEQRGEQYVGLLCLNSFVTTHGGQRLVPGRGHLIDIHEHHSCAAASLFRLKAKFGPHSFQLPTMELHRI